MKSRLYQGISFWVLYHIYPNRVDKPRSFPFFPDISILNIVQSLQISFQNFKKIALEVYTVN
jgi:hypothetical protein